MTRLSGLDASFLYLETPNAPMHIGGLSILDPATAPGFDFDAVRRLLGQRLGRAAAFRRRLAEPTLPLARPRWVEDADLDLDAHVERTQLPEPGGWHELSALMAWEMGRPLDRSRPLWQILYVEGLERVPGAPPGAIALISKMHHAAIDGVSGAEIMAALFDPLIAKGSGTAGSEIARSMPAEAPAPDTAPASDRTDADSGGLRETLGRVIRGGAAFAVRRLAPPPLPFTAPRTLFNAPVTKERVWAGATLSLERIKAIKRAADATVNDVVLAVCAGALRRYLLAHEALPKRPLVAMVPVSVRSAAERRSEGNQVSAMLVALATDAADPAARLRLVRRAAAGSKVMLQAVGARNLTDASAVVPFAVGGLAARLYTRMELADRHRPVFNLVITNVPGPRIPLAVAGARLLQHFGAAPIFDGMGLLIAVFSYAGQLSVGLVSDRRLAPDLDVLAASFAPALAELEAADLADGAR